MENMFKLVEIKIEDSNAKSYEIRTSDTDIKIGLVEQLEDGFFYFVPNKAYGCFSANDLFLIGNELDVLNEPWEVETNEYFESLGETPNFDDDFPF